jgi:transcriptional regulator with XRE-family HTH domain
MREQPSPAVLAANVAARINEFRVARGLSIDELAKAAALSSAEILVIQEGREEITTELVERIARVFNVHPAVLLMCPDEDPMAKLLEEYRDVPKAEFQRIAGELMSRGYRRSKGSA